MTAWRLTRLQQQLLRWLAAAQQRTRGWIVSSHEDLVKALPVEKGNLSRSLRTLEARGWIVIGRAPGGKTQLVMRTPEGSQRASEIGKRNYSNKANKLCKVASLFDRLSERGL
jgi:DNA-binding MarR family transcriptional regulator